jgi:hypothetical protein
VVEAVLDGPPPFEVGDVIANHVVWKFIALGFELLFGERGDGGGALGNPLASGGGGGDGGENATQQLRSVTHHLKLHHGLGTDIAHGASPFVVVVVFVGESRVTRPHSRQTGHSPPPHTHPQQAPPCG